MKIFLGISSFQILAMFRRGLFYSYLSVYLKHFLGLSVTETTLFATLPMLLNIISQRYLWGVLSDKYQKRRSLVIWGEILAGIGTVMVWYAHLKGSNPLHAGYIIIAGLSILELFWSMSNIGWSALISDLYDQDDRSSVMGKLESLGGIGRIAGIWIGGLLYDGLGLEYAGWGFYSGALFFVSAAAMFISVLPMLMVPEGGVKTGGPSGEIAVGEPYKPLGFYCFLLSIMVINFGRNSVAIILSQYFMLDSGFNLSSIALSYVANIRSVAMVLAGLILGRLVTVFNNRLLLLLGSAMAVAALSILGAAETLFPICISSFLMGVSEVVILASSYGIASLLIPPLLRGRLFSLFNATFFLSWGVAGTLISGPVIDWLIKTGEPQVFAYQCSFYTAAGITFLGILMLIFFFHASKQ